MFHTLLLRAVALPTIFLVLTCPSGFVGDEPEDAGTGSDIVEVIAEGVGTDPSDALKDAFRNAVRQVVGTLVDAELIIKNDEVVDDQILTYSGGFVKKYDEVPRSQKSVGGLHRVKIKAQVERRSVIAKLKAAKVSVMELDGKSLFAEAVTSAEAEENSTKLLAKALSDLPKVMTASVVGKPEYDRDKGELVVNVEVEVDAEAYRKFSAKLEETLGKISISKVTALVKAKPLDKGRPDLLVASKPMELMGPTIAEDKEKQWCFWVWASSTGDDRSQRWNGYVIDADILSTALPFMNRHPDRIDSPQWYDDLDLNERISSLHVFLTDETGNTVGEDELELLRWRAMEFLPWLLIVTPRNPSPPYEINYAQSVAYADIVLNFRPREGRYGRPVVANAYVAPVALRFCNNIGYGDYGYTGETELQIVRKQTYQRRINLTLDELKLVKDIKSSVSCRPVAAGTHQHFK